MKIVLVTRNDRVRNAFDSALAAKSNCQVLAFEDTGAALVALGHPAHRFTHAVIDLDLPGPDVLALGYSIVRLVEKLDIELYTIEASLGPDGSIGVVEDDTTWTISRSHMRESICAHFGVRAESDARNPTLMDQDAGQAQEEDQEHEFQLEDRITLPGGTHYLDRLAFDSYFASMTRSRLFETQVLTMKVLNINYVFEKTNPADFRKLLGHVCEALSSFFNDPSFRCTYNGGGVFFCTVDASYQFDRDQLLASMKDGDLPIATSAKLSLRKLEISVSQTKRAVGVFRSDDELARTTKFANKTSAPSSPQPKTYMRPRRVQTRLLSL